MNKSFFFLQTKKRGEKMEKTQEISCSVFDCKHCDCDKEKCKLKKIKVCNCGNEESKENTICDSYKKR